MVNLHILHNKSPLLQHLRTFECLCFATWLNNSDKFALRADISVYMGYSSTQKGYVVMNLTGFTFHISWDVFFHESVFPSRLNKEAVCALVPFMHEQHVPQKEWSAFSDEVVVDTSQIEPSGCDVPDQVSHDVSYVPHQHFNDNQDSVPSVSAYPVDCAGLPAPVRRSNRTEKSPTWLTDFKVSGAKSNAKTNAAFGLEIYLCYDHLSPS